MNITVLHHLEIYRSSLVKVLQNQFDDVQVHAINQMREVKVSEENVYIIIEPEHFVERISETLFVNFLQSSTSNFILHSFTTNFNYLNCHKISVLPINGGVDGIIKELIFFMKNLSTTLAIHYYK